MRIIHSNICIIFKEINYNMLLVVVLKLEYLYIIDSILDI